MPLLAVCEACIWVGFLLSTLRIPIEAIPTQRTGLLPYARLPALVSTVLAAALAWRIADLRLVVFATVVAVGLALGLIGVLLLRRRVVTGLSILGILLQMLLRFDLAKLYP